MFLYRFEVLKLDGATTSLVAPASYDQLQLPYRQLYLLTNNERPVNFGANEPFASAFLPKLGDMGIVANEGWRFKPERISHDEVRLDDEKGSGQLTVTLPIDHPIAQLYVLEAPGIETWLTLAEVDATAMDAKPKVIWVGQVVQPGYDEHRVTLKLDPLTAVLARPGLTAKHPRTCPHLLFDQATCRVKANAYDYATSYFKYREDGAVLSVSEDGMTVTVLAAANRPADFFADGFLVIGGEYTRTHGNAIQHFQRADTTIVLTPQDSTTCNINAGYRRTIIAHDGATLTLAVPLPPLDLTQPSMRRVTLFAGCNAIQTTCIRKFGNGALFGGYPFIPIKNLFEAGVKVATNS